jgi:3-methyl-2-oxobutanoate hydroxymethyltransferase
VNALGGYKIQGRGESADELIDDSVAVQDAGAFAVVLEMVPAPIAKKITEKLSIPTIGIGAGNGTDGQILVWTDMAGLSGGKPKKFVKQFANLRNVLMEAAASYRREVEGSQFPDSETSFEN